MTNFGISLPALVSRRIRAAYYSKRDQEIRVDDRPAEDPAANICATILPYRFTAADVRAQGHRVFWPFNRNAALRKGSFAQR
ncbi:MAG TPA: hypothetical protein VNK48_10415 [Xanthobacteraceae bacterium]|nr:hypothetical protein [Xanthobacteraceae bacterium]